MFFAIYIAFVAYDISAVCYIDFYAKWSVMPSGNNSSFAYWWTYAKSILNKANIFIL